MIDAKILPLQKAALQPAATFFARRGVRADQLSIMGFVAGLFAFGALSFGYWLAALFFVLLNRVLDGLDGAVARIQGPTDRGAYLDIAFDMVFYALIPLGFALSMPEDNALPAAVLIVSFVGTGSSFLAFSAVAAKLGRQAPKFPTKGIYYAGGLAEGFETIFVFVVMCLFPERFAVIAYSFAALCALTTLIRWRQGWIAFSESQR
ncbi:CDP-alcohol phosphatidyltransferase family protein [Rhizobium sp. AQ_MP]|uniref:CDP-alcohol phosphatidyltransferase family protein n=1 Tax=Rhizobium sp. AQ_MP TaxID=2761536 RepID=UPI00163B2FAB|nr:CDP-alcohol phosphatidyltransferase family protein [Rhizobium sp. AQ_MP]MBC2771914.1 CDP-alcohol phosphatidyltransferase family protein [Rhizobium sp. AQ_MP]